jgi:hypothetical protein
MYVTKVEFAKEVGLHRTTIAHYIRKGKLKGCVKDGKIHLEKGKVAIQQNVAPIQQKNINVRWNKKDAPTPEEVKKAADDSKLDCNMSISEAQRVKTFYDAALKKIEFDLKDGETIPAVKVKKETQDCAALIKSQLVSIPDRLSAVIAAEFGATESSRVKKLIKTEIDKSLESLHSGLMQYCD